MSLRKQKNETNRTRLRLASWLDNHPDGPAHYSEMLHPMLQDTASGLNAAVSDVAEALESQPWSIQVSAFVHEECVLRPWIGSDQRPIDEFIARQVRRERPFGRKYITNLAQSTMRIWQVVDVHPGKWIAVLPLRDTPRPEDKVRHVYDELASRSLTTRDYLLGRIIPMPEGRIFAASLLLLTKAQAGSLLGTSSSSIVHGGFVSWAQGALHMFSDSSNIRREFPSSATSQTATGRSTPSIDRETAAIDQPPAPDETFTAQNTSQDTAQNTASDSHTGSQKTQDQESAGAEYSDQQTSSQQDSSRTESAQPPDREKLLERIRKLFAMSQETEASPHEAEIALRRCQSLMTRYGITESDLHTSKFSTETFRTSHRVPMHVQWLASAMQALHSVLFVTGGGEGPEFRGFEIDVKVAKMTMEYLENAIERSLATRRRTGTFPPGRSAAYDYRVSFAVEVSKRIHTLVEERQAAEDAATVTGTSLTIRKMEIVDQECGQGLRNSNSRFFGARSGEAADAGKADGARVSLDPQVDVSRTSLIGD